MPDVRRCPRDNNDLYAEVLEGRVEVDRCPECKGVWLDAGELEALEALHAHDLDGKPAEAILSDGETVSLAYKMAQQKRMPTGLCPVCLTDLVHSEDEMGSQVIVDACPHGHGLWLEAGELDTLERYFASQHAEQAHPKGLRGLWAQLVAEIRAGLR
ncbi:MAG: zf-TFIIB domain-containing protein [Alphaproteobacteria bacterium]|nr:zf-TFIIB domain-containing protein [Alphaproteobacteria bacterium]